MRLLPLLRFSFTRCHCRRAAVGGTGLLLLLGLPGLPARAQPVAPLRLPTSGRRVADFVPRGYQLLSGSTATGDLNRDGRPDAALVLRSNAEEKEPPPAPEAEDVSPPRYLLVLFGTPSGYALAAQSGSVVLCQACGGVFGDPFESLTISKGVLLVSHYGGSSIRWSITSKFRYQTGGFFLIGETRVAYRNNGDCAESEWVLSDVNFVTGQYREEKDSESCKPLVRKSGRRPPQPLRALATYRPEP